MPTGSHTYVVSFANCRVDGLVGINLTGVASAAYGAAEWSNLTAMVSADSVRGTNLAFLSKLYDATADGSAVWTSAGSSSTKTTTYAPATGARLVNNVTSGVATFGGGSYSEIGFSSFSYEPGGRRFDNLKVAINATQYTLNGSLDSTGPSSGGTITYAGEIRITNNGTLVARIYGDVRKALAIEVLVPLVPL